MLFSYENDLLFRYLSSRLRGVSFCAIIRLRRFAVKGKLMKMIVGLGNPGRKYENTRHNIGWETLDLVAESTGIRVNVNLYHGLTAWA